jgi:hypothetical protein
MILKYDPSENRSPAPRGPFYVGVLYSPTRGDASVFATNAPSRYSDEFNDQWLDELKQPADYIIVYLEEVAAGHFEAAKVERQQLSALSPADLLSFIRRKNPDLKVVEGF